MQQKLVEGVPQLNTMWDFVGEKAALQEKYRDGNKKQQKMTKNT